MLLAGIRRRRKIMKRTMLWGMALIAALALAVTACDNPAGDGDGSSNPGGPGSSTWIWDKQTMYRVTDGAVGGVQFEVDAHYTEYTDSGHYSYEYEYTQPMDSTVSYDTYTYIQTGYQKISLAYTLSGDTASQAGNSVMDYTTVIDYVSTGTPDSTTTHYQEHTFNSLLYAETGIHLQQSTHSSIITNSGAPVVSNTTTNYTLETLSEVDGIKTLKHYDTSTGGTGYHTIYTVKDKVVLEEKSYSAPGVLFYTRTYTFPDNPVIREKLPTFTVFSMTYETAPGNNSYQTAEVVSNTETQLTLRNKQYNAGGTLTNQYDTRFKKM
jgi:hypothetical protein